MNYQNSERDLSIVPVYATRAELGAALRDKQVFDMTTRHLPNVSVPLSGDVGSFGSLKIEVFDANDNFVVDLGEPNFGVGVIYEVNGTTDPEYVFNTFPTFQTPLPIPAGGFYYWRITELVNQQRVFYAGWFRVHDLEGAKITPPSSAPTTYQYNFDGFGNGVELTDTLGGIPNTSPQLYWQWWDVDINQWVDFTGGLFSNVKYVSASDASNRNRTDWRRVFPYTDANGVQWIGRDYFEFDGTNFGSKVRTEFETNRKGIGRWCDDLVQWRVFPQSTIPSDFRGGGILNTDGVSMSYVGRAVLDFPIIEENVNETENGLGFRTTISRSVRKRQQLVFQMVPDHAIFPMQLMLSKYWSPDITDAVLQLEWVATGKTIDIEEPAITIEPSTNGLVATVRMIFTSQQVFQHWGVNDFPPNPTAGAAGVSRVSPNLPFYTQNQP